MTEVVECWVNTVSVTSKLQQEGEISVREGKRFGRALERTRTHDLILRFICVDDVPGGLRAKESSWYVINTSDANEKQVKKNISTLFQS